MAFADADAIEARWTDDVLAYAGADTRPLFVREYSAHRNRKAGVRFDREATRGRATTVGS